MGRQPEKDILKTVRWHESTMCIHTHTYTTVNTMDYSCRIEEEMLNALKSQIHLYRGSIYKESRKCLARGGGESNQ